LRIWKLDEEGERDFPLASGAAFEDGKFIHPVLWRPFDIRHLSPEDVPTSKDMAHNRFIHWLATKDASEPGETLWNVSQEETRPKIIWYSLAGRAVSTHLLGRGAKRISSQIAVRPFETPEGTRGGILYILRGSKSSPRLLPIQAVLLYENGKFLRSPKVFSKKEAMRLEQESKRVKPRVPGVPRTQFDARAQAYRRSHRGYLLRMPKAWRPTVENMVRRVLGNQMSRLRIQYPLDKTPEFVDRLTAEVVEVYPAAMKGWANPKLRSSFTAYFYGWITRVITRKLKGLTGEKSSSVATISETELDIPLETFSEDYDAQVERSLDDVVLDAALKRLARINPKWFEAWWAQHRKGVTLRELADQEKVSPERIRQRRIKAEGWLSKALSSSGLEEREQRKKAPEMYRVISKEMKALAHSRKVRREIAKGFLVSLSHRQGVAHAVGRSVPGLVRLLAKRKRVSQAAEEVLASIIDSGRALTTLAKQVPLFNRYLSHKKTHVRSASQRLLTRMAEKGNIPLHLKAIGETAPSSWQNAQSGDPDLKEAAVQTLLAYIDHGVAPHGLSKLVPELTKALQGRDEELKKAAAAILWKMESRKLAASARKVHVTPEIYASIYTYAHSGLEEIARWPKEPKKAEGPRPIKIWWNEALSTELSPEIRQRVEEFASGVRQPSPEDFTGSGWRSFAVDLPVTIGHGGVTARVLKNKGMWALFPAGDGKVVPPSMEPFVSTGQRRWHPVFHQDGRVSWRQAPSNPTVAVLFEEIEDEAWASVRWLEKGLPAPMAVAYGQFLGDKMLFADPKQAGSSIPTGFIVLGLPNPVDSRLEFEPSSEEFFRLGKLLRQIHEANESHGQPTLGQFGLWKGTLYVQDLGMAETLTHGTQPAAFARILHDLYVTVASIAIWADPYAPVDGRLPYRTKASQIALRNFFRGYFGEDFQRAELKNFSFRALGTLLGVPGFPKERKIRGLPSLSQLPLDVVKHPMAKRILQSLAPIVDGLPWPASGHVGSRQVGLEEVQPLTQVREWASPQVQERIDAFLKRGLKAALLIPVTPQGLEISTGSQQREDEKKPIPLFAVPDILAAAVALLPDGYRPQPYFSISAGHGEQSKFELAFESAVEFAKLTGIAVVAIRKDDPIYKRESGEGRLMVWLLDGGSWDRVRRGELKVIMERVDRPGDYVLDLTSGEVPKVTIPGRGDFYLIYA
jgi:RNA polymerase sigma factor (sigma-70 family)